MEDINSNLRTNSDSTDEDDDDIWNLFESRDKETTEILESAFQQDCTPAEIPAVTASSVATRDHTQNSNVLFTAGADYIESEDLEDGSLRDRKREWDNIDQDKDSEGTDRDKDYEKQSKAIKKSAISIPNAEEIPDVSDINDFDKVTYNNVENDSKISIDTNKNQITILKPLSSSLALNQLGTEDHIYEKDIPLITMIGNSWTCEDKMITEPHVGTKKVSISPHEVVVGINTPEGGAPAYGNISFAWFRHMSAGCLTYEDALTKQSFIDQWANDVPRVTVLQMGACFIAKANKTSGIRAIYREQVIEFVNKWLVATRKSCKNEQRLRTYTQRVQCHRWVLVGIPDWGDHHICGMSNKQYKGLKRAANDAMKNCENLLWTKYSMIVCRPRIDNPKLIGESVHLAPESQKEFAEQVLRIASFVACSHCKLTQGRYVKAEHDRVHPKDGNPTMILTCEGRAVPETLSHEDQCDDQDSRIKKMLQKKLTGNTTSATESKQSVYPALDENTTSGSIILLQPKIPKKKKRKRNKKNIEFVSTNDGCRH